MLLLFLRVILKTPEAASLTRDSILCVTRRASMKIQEMARSVKWCLPSLMGGILVLSVSSAYGLPECQGTPSRGCGYIKDKATCNSSYQNASPAAADAQCRWDDGWAGYLIKRCSHDSRFCKVPHK